MLDKAYVLPDGRRVFKSADGLRVYDEHGAEIGGDIIDPEMISDHLIRSNAYLDTNSDLRQLEKQRSKLLDGQKKLDDFKNRLADGNVFEDELDSIKRGVENAMLMSARRFVEKSAVDEIPNQIPQLTKSFNGQVKFTAKIVYPQHDAVTLPY